MFLILLTLFTFFFQNDDKSSKAKSLEDMLGCDNTFNELVGDYMKDVKAKVSDSKAEVDYLKIRMITDHILVKSNNDPAFKAWICVQLDVISRMIKKTYNFTQNCEIFFALLQLTNHMQKGVRRAFIRSVVCFEKCSEEMDETQTQLFDQLLLISEPTDFDKNITQEEEMVQIYHRVFLANNTETLAQDN